MRVLYSLLLILFVSSGPTAAQSGTRMEPIGYFDFWIGSWELTFTQSDGREATAKNKIEKILSGKTIQENFEVLSGKSKGYSGKSWSVYNPNTKSWKQTWVDSQGAYLTFDGRKEGEKRIFSRTTTNSEGRQIIQRMVFYDIKENSFIWDWEQSKDAGQNWTLLWRINYSRKQ